MQASYSDEFTESFAKLDKPVREVASKKVKKILEAPFLGKPLRGGPYLFSERFLQYRIVYEMEGESIIFLRLGKLDAVYRIL